MARIIASIGHSDRLVISDCGLPIPRNAEVVDLALSEDISRFLYELRVILEEFHTEEAIIAKEILEMNTSVYDQMVSLLPKIKLIKIALDDLKKVLNELNNITFVRNGEATPYANIILISGVTF
ncbi:D-ribose pyranase [candidate division KSB1 bacterium]|nr:D-ribose pyranase [candidate division KSB1 bacterium]